MRLSKQLNSICEKALDVKFNEYSDIIEYIKNMTGSGFILDKLSKDTYELSTYRMSGIYQNASVLCKEKDLEPLKKMTSVEEQQKYLLNLVTRDKKAIKEADEDLNNKINEAIRAELVSWKADFLDSLNGEIDETLNEIAESHGYSLYDDALVINVKRRPYISLDLAGLGVPEDAVEDAIYSFINHLTAKWDDFVVLGRSGGYWGFEKATSQVDITTEGYNKLFEKTKEILDTDFKEDLEEAGDDISEITSVVYSAINSSISDIAEALLDDTALAFEEDLMNKMSQLREAIDKEEAAMNNEDYWIA